MSLNLLTIQAQQCLLTTQNTITQLLVGGSVQGTGCNTLITTASLSIPAGTGTSFAYNNPLISSGTNISAAITGSSSTAGTPVLSISGQSTGSAWLTITNQAITTAINGTLNIAVLVYPSV